MPVQSTPASRPNGARQAPRASKPRRRASSSRSGQGVPGWAVGGGIALVALIGFAFLVSGKEAPVRAEKPPEPEPVLGMDNPRVKGVADWVRFVGEGNKFEVQLRSKLTSLRAQLTPAGAAAVPATGEDMRAVEAQLLERLLSGAETQIFRDYELARAELVDKSMAEARSGRVRVALMSRNARVYDEATAEVSFDWEPPIAKITGWQVTYVPKAPLPAVPKSTHKAHDKIGAIAVSEGTLDGKTFKKWEADVVPLPHLPDTPAALQQEIDARIADLVNMEAMPRVRTQAIRRLKEIGKPAVPRLLNKFYEIPGKTHDERLSITQITRLLRDMTNKSFGYTPEETSVYGGKEATDAARQSALRQWYAWWAVNYDRELPKPKDDEALEEELPPEKPKAPRTPPKRTPQ